MDLSTNSVQDVNITVATPPAVAITVPAVVTVDMPITGVGGIKGDKGDKGDAGSPGAPGTTDYNALTNKPTIPTTTSQLTNNSGFLTSYTETDPVFVASPAHNITSTHITTLGNTSGTNTGDETSTTIKTKLGISTLSGSNTGDQDLSSYATTSALTTGLAGKQATLVSGTNIKTINGTNVLGSGDITIAGGTSSDATTSAKGIIQLAGDLAGTAAFPTVPGLSSKLTAVLAGTHISSENNTHPTVSVTDITGFITHGTNVTVTGTGTTADPYVISATAGGGSTSSISATNSKLDVGVDTTTFGTGQVLLSDPTNATAQTGINAPADLYISSHTNIDGTGTFAPQIGFRANDLQLYGGDSFDSTTGLIELVAQNTTVGGKLTLAADPATSLEAATKQYVDAHAGGTGDMTKAVYDPTAKNADAFSMDNMADGTSKHYVTTAEKTVLDATSGTNTGDETAATIKSKLSITTLSGSNTGDQTSVTGNAGTATTLQTARTIAGVSFNGSANISIASTNLSDTASIAMLTSTQTLTNKRITQRIGTATSSATPSINTDSFDSYNLTAQAAAITSFTLSGTPTDHQELLIRIKATGAFAITAPTNVTNSGLATFPTTTVSSKTITIGLRYDAAASAWICLAADATGY